LTHFSLEKMCSLIYHSHILIIRIYSPQTQIKCSEGPPPEMTEGGRSPANFGSFWDWNVQYPFHQFRPQQTFIVWCPILLTPHVCFGAAANRQPDTSAFQIFSKNNPSHRFFLNVQKEHLAQGNAFPSISEGYRHDFGNPPPIWEGHYFLVKCFSYQLLPQYNSLLNAKGALLW